MVVLVPVVTERGTGLLVVRRALDPGRGLLALPGGFLDADEEWAAGGARELREETGLVVDPSALEPVWFTSSVPRANRVLLYARAPAVPIATLPPFAADAEVTERGAVLGPADLAGRFAFGTDAAAVERFFAGLDVTGPSAFRRL